MGEQASLGGFVLNSLVAQLRINWGGSKASSLSLGLEPFRIVVSPIDAALTTEPGKM